MDIVIDFDGTVVTHDYPHIGKDIGAVPVLKELLAAGHRLILFTMRSNGVKGDLLTDAVYWFQKHNIPLFGIQRNPDQDSWTTSPKAYGRLIIDDAALGCPLTWYDENMQQISDRLFVDWQRVREFFVQHGVLPPLPSTKPISDNHEARPYS